jgi:hypothetical protein
MLILSANLLITFRVNSNSNNNRNNVKIKSYIILIIFNLSQYCAGGKIEKNEMSGACGAYGRGERCAQGSGGEI